MQPPASDDTLDFSSGLSDPANTSYLLPAYNSGGDIHPNAMGCGMMVKAVPLNFFQILARTMRLMQQQLPFRCRSKWLPAGEVISRLSLETHWSLKVAV